MISTVALAATESGVLALVAASFVLGALFGFAAGFLSVCRPIEEPPDDFRGENL